MVSKKRDAAGKLGRWGNNPSLPAKTARPREMAKARRTASDSTEARTLSPDGAVLPYKHLQTKTSCGNVCRTRLQMSINFCNRLT